MQTKKLVLIVDHNVIIKMLNVFASSEVNDTE